MQTPSYAYVLNYSALLCMCFSLPRNFMYWLLNELINISKLALHVYVDSISFKFMNIQYP